MGGWGGGGKGINWPAILKPFSMMCFIDHDVGYKFFIVSVLFSTSNLHDD